jgi:general secretion pathway protein C
VNWLFRRHFWVVHLAFMSLTALLLAKTSSTILGYWVLKAIPQPPKMHVKPPAAKKKENDFEAANERNIFQAKREQLSADMDEAGDMGDPGNWEDAGPTTLPLKLVSTTVAYDPFSSRTVILNTSTNIAKVHSIGECEPYQKLNNPDIETVLGSQDWIPDRACNDVDKGTATVVRIESFRVYIFNNQARRYEYLAMGAEGQRARPRSSVSGPPVEGEGIRKVGANSYEIDQSELNRALTNIGKLMTEARAMPESDGQGNIIGFKIISMKEGSLFEKIGLEKMDVLVRVNGNNLSSPEAALGLFSKLRFQERFSIDIKRGDRSVTLDYSVTP